MFSAEVYLGASRVSSGVSGFPGLYIKKKILCIKFTAKIYYNFLLFFVPGQINHDVCFGLKKPKSSIKDTKSTFIKTKIRKIDITLGR